jgi:predicted component of type VI protein secretion system
MTYQLVMKSAPYQDKSFPLVKDETTIGRDTTSDIVISDAEISRRHARIYKLGDSYMVEDLGSTNGTFVNGQRLVGPHALLPGETIRFGENIMLVFEAPLPPYDPNATIVTAGEAFNLPPAPVMPEPVVPEPVIPKPAFSLPEIPQPVPQPGIPQPVSEPPVFRQQPSFQGTLPEAPVVVPPVKKEKKNRNLILAGVALVLLLCCACLIGFAWWFDANNYWSLIGL